MRVELLGIDLDELAQLAVSPDEALGRAAAELGRRPTHERPKETPRTEAAVRELVHLSAEAIADMRLLRFSFAAHAYDYARSRRRHELVEDAMADLRLHTAPRMRACLRDLRIREEELEGLLAARGIDASSIGPFVPPGTAIDPTPRPGEMLRQQPRLAPLLPRRRRAWRLLGRRLPLG